MNDRQTDSKAEAGGMAGSFDRECLSGVYTLFAILSPEIFPYLRFVTGFDCARRSETANTDKTRSRWSAVHGNDDCPGFD